MQPATIRILREEHAALAALLRSIGLLLKQHRGDASLPDFGALRAMLFYIDEFPEKRHHPKESELLFAKLRARAPRARELLDELDAEHARGERLVRELHRALLAFEMLGEPRRAEFEACADTFARFYLAHMAKEEQDVLPLALQTLTAGDWAELDEAFLSNKDPLTGHEPEADYRALFTRIVNTVPAPIGLGS